jgi:hypothetical protein
MDLTPFSVQATDRNADTGILIRNGKQFLTRVTVIQQAGATVQGGTGSVFYLQKADDSVPDDQTRRVHFVPYFSDTTCGATLGSGAHYMFTPTMDGCTFGVGSQCGKSSVLVMHSNSKTSGDSYGTRDAGALDQQERVQKILLSSAFKSNNDSLASSIAPSGYMALNGGISLGADIIKSTTFGRLRDGTWSFYALRYRYMAGGGLTPVFAHEGIHKA